jgi:outer membrane protein insertion porin family
VTAPFAPLALALLLLGAARPPAPSELVQSVELLVAAEDRERLARYVLLRPGGPLDPEAIRRTVELLHATGAFRDVVVETSEGPDGLQVQVRPLPAPRLSRLERRGDAVLTPKELRRVTRLRFGEALWPARLERAAQDAGVALSERGYLEGRVTIEVVGEGAAAVAVVGVHAGPRARVGSTRLLGLSSELAHAAQQQLRPRRGEVWSRARADEAAAEVVRLLRSAGRWRARASVLIAYDPSTAKVDVTFEVAPGPRCAVAFEGSALPGDLKREVEKRLIEGGLAADALEAAADRIETELRARGHRNALVAQREEIGNDAVTVYEVAAGPLSQVASLRVVGWDGPLPAFETRAGLPVRDASLEADARALTAALEEQGYSEARVEAELSDAGGSVPVTFRVRPGPRTLVSAVEVLSPVASIEVKTLRLRSAAAYRVRDVARDKATLLAAYRDAGYPQARVEPEIEFAEDRTSARILLRVEPGPFAVVEELVVAGLDTTNERVVLREMALRAGEPLGLANVLESQRRLQALGAFERVSIRELDASEASRRTLIVTADEASRTAVSYGVGYAERDLFRASAEVTRRNLWGMDRSLSTFARVSFRGSRLFTTYREPRLFDRRQELFLTGFREEEDRPSFDFLRFGGLVQTAQPVGARFNVILRYAYQKTDTFNVQVPLSDIDREFQSSTFSGPSASLVLDTRSDPLDPRDGAFVGADLSLSHGLLGGDSFVKGFLQASAYRPLRSRLTLALSGRLGLSRTFGDEPPRLPLPDRFFAGGDYSLRGYEVDTAGPLERTPQGALVPTGGNGLVFGGAELRVDASRHIALAAFSEAANVYPLVRNLDLRELRYVAGLGLRYRSALGPLRLDWGYKLNRRPGEKAYDIHFTVGHAF